MRLRLLLLSALCASAHAGRLVERASVRTQRAQHGMQPPASPSVKPTLLRLRGGGVAPTSPAATNLVAIIADQLAYEVAHCTVSKAKFFGFCGACCNWFLGLSAVNDAFRNGPEMISLQMTLAMLAYSLLFSRWAGWELVKVTNPNTHPNSHPHPNLHPNQLGGLGRVSGKLHVGWLAHVQHRGAAQPAPPGRRVRYRRLIIAPHLDHASAASARVAPLEGSGRSGTWRLHARERSLGRAGASGGAVEPAWSALKMRTLNLEPWQGARPARRLLHLTVVYVFTHSAFLVSLAYRLCLHADRYKLDKEAGGKAEISALATKTLGVASVIAAYTLAAPRLKVGSMATCACTCACTCTTCTCHMCMCMCMRMSPYYLP